MQCLNRYYYIKPGIKRGQWSEEEDNQLKQLYNIYSGKWSIIAEHMNGRSGKQIRERYINKLDPKVNKKSFTPEEDEQILRLQKIYGNKWKVIAKEMNGRTPDMIKCRFYSKLVYNHKKNKSFISACDTGKDDSDNESDLFTNIFKDIQNNFNDEVSQKKIENFNKNNLLEEERELLLLNKKNSNLNTFLNKKRLKEKLNNSKSNINNKEKIFNIIKVNKFKNTNKNNNNNFLIHFSNLYSVHITNNDKDNPDSDINMNNSINNSFLQINPTFKDDDVKTFFMFNDFYD